MFTEDVYALPHSIYHALEKERMAQVTYGDEGIALYRASLPSLPGVSSQTLGWIVYGWNDGADVSFIFWHDRLERALKGYKNGVEFLNSRHKVPERSATMHEKEKYHLGKNDELLVDCKGGPLNVPVQDKTEAEEEIHKQLLAKKNGQPAEAPNAEELGPEAGEPAAGDPDGAPETEDDGKEGE